jgi:DNA-binding NtrC family response regulator
MAKKTILLIADAQKTESSVRDAVGAAYHLERVKGGKEAAAYLAKSPADLIIIDFDLKGEDGLRIFRDLGVSAKTIMLSASGSIPLAVSAAKLGVEEFLRKPVNAAELTAAVERNISKSEVRLRWNKGMEWLQGTGPALKKMHAQVQEALRENRDVILAAGPGTPVEQAAEFIHANSGRRERRLVKMDLAAFHREDLEAHFWASMQELLSVPDASSAQNGAERCGTLFLANLDGLDEHFKLAVLKFFAERRGKTDRSVRVIIGVRGRNAVPAPRSKDYVWIEVPQLGDRKEDVPYLLGVFLKRYARRYGREITMVSTDILDFLAAYDYPGSYLELERLIEGAVLAAPADKLEMEHFPLTSRGLLHTALNRGLRRNLTLEEARRHFEKELYPVLAKKSGGDQAKVARFLDVPRTVLTQRMENLTD